MSCSHQLFFHPETEDLEKAFSAAARPTTVFTRWSCYICGKLFTRGFHQRNHIRSHNGDRPYACSECGRSFTRANAVRGTRRFILDGSNKRTKDSWA